MRLLTASRARARGRSIRSPSAMRSVESVRRPQPGTCSTIERWGCIPSGRVVAVGIVFDAGMRPKNEASLHAYSWLVPPTASKYLESTAVWTATCLENRDGGVMPGGPTPLLSAGRQPVRFRPRRTELSVVSGGPTVLMGRSFTG